MTRPTLIPSSDVRERLGGISESTLYRYMASETLNFPKSFTFGRRHMWDAAEIDDFIIARRNAAFAPDQAQAPVPSPTTG